MPHFICSHDFWLRQILLHMQRLRHALACSLLLIALILFLFYLFSSFGKTNSGKQHLCTGCNKTPKLKKASMCFPVGLDEMFNKCLLLRFPLAHDPPAAHAHKSFKWVLIWGWKLSPNECTISSFWLCFFKATVLGCSKWSVKPL